MPNNSLVRPNSEIQRTQNYSWRSKMVSVNEEERGSTLSKAYQTLEFKDNRELDEFAEEKR